MLNYPIVDGKEHELDAGVPTTGRTDCVWVVVDGSNHVKARVEASADMDQTPGQLMTHFGDDWRIRVAANDDGLSTDEARNLADLLNKAADWIDQME